MVGAPVLLPRAAQGHPPVGTVRGVQQELDLDRLAGEQTLGLDPDLLAMGRVDHREQLRGPEVLDRAAEEPRGLGIRVPDLEVGTDLVHPRRHVLREQPEAVPGPLGLVDEAEHPHDDRHHDEHRDDRDRDLLGVEMAVGDHRDRRSDEHRGGEEHDPAAVHRGSVDAGRTPTCRDDGWSTAAATSAYPIG